MNTNWEKPIEEITVLANEIVSNGINAVLFDSYRMTKEYFTLLGETLNRAVRIAYIDDLFEEIYPVDVLVNYNAYHVQFPYKEAYEGNGRRTRLCLGSSYVPLREEFGKTDLSDGCENTVLLSCGGGDTLQSLHGILERAVTDKRFHDTEFHVIVGRYHQKKERLEQLAAAHDNIILHHNVSNMAELMEQNCIAVSAAGTMLYELCAMERPTVFFITADNQRYDSDFFAADDRMYFAGDIRKDRETCIGQVLDGMHELLSDKKMRICMKEKLREVTDGKGASRIARILEEM